MRLVAREAVLRQVQRGTHHFVPGLEAAGPDLIVRKIPQRLDPEDIQGVFWRHVSYQRCRGPEE
ncbi:MAG: hypothetical protein J0H19_06215 [Rhodospirillales bacterium]|nr:hypothetical protein [Rhodospirillales bacterium]MBN8905033.1 hypothetical protein [Rhodospirillales bacterium]MBN8926200.1 hypothetical protein [Rhodospirillales bacterium]